MTDLADSSCDIQGQYRPPESANSLDRGLLVEFVGAAGVGKSTVLRELEIVLGSCGVPVINLDVMHARTSGWVEAVLLAKAALLALLLKPPSMATYWLTVKQLYRYSQRKTAASKSGNIHICSEGIFHRMRAIHRSRPAVKMTEISDRIFQLVDPPDFVVVIEAGAESIYERRTRRARADDKSAYEAVCADVLLLQDSIQTIKHAQTTVAPQLRMLRINLDASSAPCAAKDIASSICDAGARPRARA